MLATIRIKTRPTWMAHRPAPIAGETDSTTSLLGGGTAHTWDAADPQTIPIPPCWLRTRRIPMAPFWGIISARIQSVQVPGGPVGLHPLWPNLPAGSQLFDEQLHGDTRPIRYRWQCVPTRNQPRAHTLPFSYPFQHPLAFSDISILDERPDSINDGVLQPPTKRRATFICAMFLPLTSVARPAFHLPTAIP